ncbi:ras GEF [Leucogyrophana mollusca]|uniref:Ras GEF n=1 Tax=Leucogyrophana mollusca TaxID=85980 RepID=A0ACB8BAX5_9AGAM|nr:ras GEF [Leucogyrophana mollusca]
MQTGQSRTPRQSLKLSIDASPFRYQPHQSSPSPSSCAGLTASGSTPGTTGSDWFICQVICLYDFESEDPDQLCFKQNEILTIVKKEDSGWWAAVRPPGDRLGWIPSAFVEPLGDDAEHNEQTTRDPGQASQIGIENARSFDTESMITGTPYLGSNPYFGTQDEDWVPVVEDFKVPSLQLVTPTDLVAKLALHDTEGRRGSFESFFNLSDDEQSPLTMRAPPSPNTLMPKPPLPQDLPPSAVHKEPLVKRPVADAVTRHSDSPVAIGSRHVRPRPMLVDDRDSLTRLSALLESYPHESYDVGVKPSAKTKKTVDGPVPQRDKLDVDADGVVKAGTLGALVDKLIADQTPTQNLGFRETFLLTFRTFVSPNRLLDMLVERFNAGLSQDPSHRKRNGQREKDMRAMQDRVLAVLAIWLENYRLLDEEPHISQRIVRFLSGIQSPPQSVLMAKQMIGSFDRLVSQQPLTRKCRNGARKYRKPKAHANDLLRWDPNDIAEQLCLIDHDLYSAVRPQECLNWRKAHTGKDVANIIAFFDMHGQLFAWVKSSVLNSDAPTQRAKTIDFWTRVADTCRNTQNYHSLHAILAGLSDPDISRLHLTWAHFSLRSLFEALVKVCDPSVFKSTIQPPTGPCVPPLRPFLMDVLQIEKDLSDNVTISTTCGDTLTLISFAKRQKLHDVVSTMLRYQSQPYEFAVSESTRCFIQGQFRVASFKNANWFSIRSREAKHAEHTQAENIMKGLNI